MKYRTPRKLEKKIVREIVLTSLEDDYSDYFKKLYENYEEKGE